MPDTDANLTAFRDWLESGEIDPDDVARRLTDQPELATEILRWLKRAVHRSGALDVAGASDEVHSAVDRLLDLSHSQIDNGVRIGELAGRDILKLTLNLSLLERRTDTATVAALLRKPFLSLPDEYRDRAHVLLRSEYEVVAFIGRGAELSELQRWCDGDQAFAARLYLGPGGSGKTRLAVDLCRRLRHSGWAAHFVEDPRRSTVLEQSPALVDLLLDPIRPRLLVVDYAETRSSQVTALLDGGLRLTDRGHGQPVRLLLLARSRGDWWPDLLHSSADYLNTGLAAEEPYDLLPLVDDPARRQTAYRAAKDAFGQHVEPTQSAPAINAVPDLSADHFAQVLFIHIAAFTAMLGKPATGRTELLDAMLSHERRYWQGRAADLRIEEVEALPGVVAMIILAGGYDTRDEVREAAKLHPMLTDARAVTHDRVARLMEDLYSGDGRMDPLRPDTLGEHLVAQQVAERRELLSTWLAASDDRAAQNGLVVLNRLGAYDELATGWIEQELQNDLERLAPMALAVASQAPLPIGRALLSCAHDGLGPDLARKLESRLPDRSVELRELSVEVTRQALGGVADDTEDAKVVRAGLLNNLGNRLSDLGRREDALAAAQEAVDLYRQLAADRPDAFLPDLAMSLNNLGRQSHRPRAPRGRPRRRRRPSTSTASWPPTAPTPSSPTSP